MQVEHQCPQCGGAITVEETDRLLQCTYCKTRLYVEAKDYFRYCLTKPGGPAAETGTVYIPYWRFKGMHFLCRTKGIESGLIDKTLLALLNSPLPPTLGIRAQSLGLRPARPSDGVRFITPNLAFDNSFVETKKLVSYELVTTKDTELISLDGGRTVVEVPVTQTEIKENRIYHEAFIADAQSIVYAPAIVKNGRVYDAISMEQMSVSPDIITPQDPPTESDWAIRFVSTICPNCGWDLVAEKDSYILVCSRCASAWQVSGASLNRIPFAVATSPGINRKAAYLPFWRLKINASVIDLNSYEDLIRLANLPKAIKPEWSTREAHFLVPAFKVAPSVFLRIAKQMTLAETVGDLSAEFPHDPIIYPANITLPEAHQSLKTIITDIAIRKLEIMSRLDEINISTVESLLVFHPFVDTGYELAANGVSCTVMKTALKWGKNI